MADPRTSPAPEGILTGPPRKWSVTEGTEGAWSAQPPADRPQPFDASAAPAWTVTEDAAPVHEEQPSEETPVTSGSTLELVAAGFAVFDSILAISYVAFWNMNVDSLLALLQQFGGFSLIASIVPILVGSFILNRNRKGKRYAAGPGTSWALGAVLAGFALGLLTLFIPFVAALQVLTGDGV